MNSNIKIIGRGDMAMGMFGIVKESVQAFIDDEALTRGAAIAFYTITLSVRSCSSWSRSPGSRSARMLRAVRFPVSFPA